MDESLSGEKKTAEEASSSSPPTADNPTTADGIGIDTSAGTENDDGLSELLDSKVIVIRDADTVFPVVWYNGGSPPYPEDAFGHPPFCALKVREKF